MTHRTEIDHLRTADAFNALGTPGTVTGLGYNTGAVSYSWEMAKQRGGHIVVTIEGAFTVTASLHRVVMARHLSVCAFVASLVNEKTGNCAATFCKLLGE